MTRVDVRSSALLGVAARLDGCAEAVRDEAAVLAASAVRGPGLAPDLRARLTWLAGPAGLWGEALSVEALAARLRAAARAYEEVERAVASLLRSVGAAADRAGTLGWLVDGTAGPGLDPVPPRWDPRPVTGAGDLVALGADLDGGRVRVVELERPDGGSAWVVAVPGTQEWSPTAGGNPFDLTADVRAVTGDATVAAAGVTAALARAQRDAGRGAEGRQDPVLLVGHSQGGIHAAALAADPAFRRRFRTTHVVTTGAPVGLFPVPPSVDVLSVEHADDPVPTLDLTPNPARDTWRTLRVGSGPAVDAGRHAREGYEATVRAAEGAPRGTVSGLDAWEVGVAAFLHRPVRSVTETQVRRVVASTGTEGRM
ncbi:hypothetical protein KC207_08255 [Phycicoccus sp. BSK3Z-2]|uniref:Alpha/beta hydrolase n=1 Tax=Phycicoccus avicenniae TaxID=2828860 RepID=A0A941D709_9MICO|nr:hypothetical protein [Phycicoccus avicenniae]MBR7743279.1 hypothetical protein [Phycicoccus avicenniae]